MSAVNVAISYREIIQRPVVGGTATAPDGNVVSRIVGAYAQCKRIVVAVSDKPFHYDVVNSRGKVDAVRVKTIRFFFVKVANIQAGCFSYVYMPVVASSYRNVVYFYAVTTVNRDRNHMHVACATYRIFVVRIINSVDYATVSVHTFRTVVAHTDFSAARDFYVFAILNKHERVVHQRRKAPRYVPTHVCMSQIYLIFVVRQSGRLQQYRAFLDTKFHVAFKRYARRNVSVAVRFIAKRQNDLTSTRLTYRIYRRLYSRRIVGKPIARRVIRRNGYVYRIIFQRKRVRILSKIVIVGH